MANFNKVILMGNLTRDPQLRYLPSNVAVCEFGLAVNRRFRDRDGNQKEETCFVDVSAFGRQAENINQYMTKGRPLLIEGRLRYDQWTGQDGQKRSKLVVIAETFQFLGGREGGSSGYEQRGGQAPADAAAPERAGPSAEPSADDIPF